MAFFDELIPVFNTVRSTLIPAGISLSRSYADTIIGSGNTPVTQNYMFQSTLNVSAGSPFGAASDDATFVLKESDLLKRTFNIYWHLITAGTTTQSVNSGAATATNEFYPFHLAYAYCLESTRIAQIFERVIFEAFSGEKLGILRTDAVKWLRTTEDLFYDDTQFSPYATPRNYIRSNAEATRRNAYFRLMGMELPHGATNEPSNPTFEFHRPAAANTKFVASYENLLREVWQALINAQNTAGTNTSDVVSVTRRIADLKEMLLARRTANPADLWNQYENTSLAQEEFSAVLMQKWLHQAISTNTPIVEALGARANTPGERLEKIGARVGIQAHPRSQDLIDLAIPLATFLRMIEQGFYDTQTTVQLLLDKNQMVGQDMMTQIHLWQKTTGKKIKD
ncbi:MAG: hypothetical protein RL757_2456 [Bacteroidota bacterium]|jgi:hypothetical protein